MLISPDFEHLLTVNEFRGFSRVGAPRSPKALQMNFRPAPRSTVSTAYEACGRCHAVALNFANAQEVLGHSHQGSVCVSVLPTVQHRLITEAWRQTSSLPCRRPQWNLRQSERQGKPSWLRIVVPRYCIRASDVLRHLWPRSPVAHHPAYRSQFRDLDSFGYTSTLSFRATGMTKLPSLNQNCSWGSFGGCAVRWPVELTAKKTII